MPKSDRKLTLVLGVDGSGKSTFMNGLRQELAYEVLEPTSTDEARAFKARHIDTPVDESFVDQRESLYLRANKTFATLVESELATGTSVATSGSALVTKVSHAVMKRVLGAVSSTHPMEMACDWLARPEEPKPDALVLVHASPETILSRIGMRLGAGDETEKFWGFNSPYFLLNYQETWHDVLEKFSEAAEVPCLTLDTDILTPAATIDVYRQAVGI